MNFSFTDVQGNKVVIPLASGEIVFVLGPNGSGKSSLMHKLYLENESYSERIAADRHISLSSNAVTLAAAQRGPYLRTIKQRDRQADAQAWSQTAQGALRDTGFDPAAYNRGIRQQPLSGES